MTNGIIEKLYLNPARGKNGNPPEFNNSLDVKNPE
jgi:hypothetical protein